MTVIQYKMLDCGEFIPQFVWDEICSFAAKAKKGKRHKRLASKMACNWHLTGDVWGKTRTIVGPTKCKKSREQRLRSLQKERGL